MLSHWAGRPRLSRRQPRAPKQRRRPVADLFPTFALRLDSAHLGPPAWLDGGRAENAEGVVELDAEISNRALQLRVSEQKLRRPHPSAVTIKTAVQPP